MLGRNICVMISLQLHPQGQKKTHPYPIKPILEKTHPTTLLSSFITKDFHACLRLKKVQAKPQFQGWPHHSCHSAKADKHQHSKRPIRQASQSSKWFFPLTSSVWLLLIICPESSEGSSDSDQTSSVTQNSESESSDSEDVTLGKEKSETFQTSIAAFIQLSSLSTYTISLTSTHSRKKEAQDVHKEICKAIRLSSFTTNHPTSRAACWYQRSTSSQCTSYNPNSWKL